MYTMSSSPLLNCTFYKVPFKHDVIVSLSYLTNGNATKSKDVSLKDFVSFIKNFDSDNTILFDSGFMTDSLIRKVCTQTVDHYFFFYDKIRASYTHRDATISTEYLAIVKKVFPDFKQNGNPIVLNNLLFHVRHNKSTDVLQYNIHFCDLKKNMFQEFESLSLDTVLYKSFFPNTFSDSICWGSNVSTTEIYQAGKDGNIKFLSSLPHIFFNSTFNNDLLWSAYGYIYLLSTETPTITAFRDKFKSLFIDKGVTEEEWQDFANAIHYSSGCLFKYIMSIILREDCDEALYELFLNVLSEASARGEVPIPPKTTLKDLCKQYNI